MAVGDNYILPGQSDHDRLRVISEIHDGATRDLLLQAGLAEGARFVVAHGNGWTAEPLIVKNKTLTIHENPL